VSTFTINEICYRVVHEPAFRAAILADPAAELAQLELSDDERRALLDGNVGQLYLWGANTYMLGHLTRYGIFGLNRERYANSIWAAARAAGRSAGGP
jgi:hypothetical protein